MRVRDNSLSLLTWRNFSGAGAGVDRSLIKLSSGLAINSAADNAAGLAISERMTGQFRGLIQANRNAMDGLSLALTADSALNEVSALLQRGRELAVQAANGVYAQQDKQSIQTEITHVLAEIDRISDTATFNNNRLLSPIDNVGVITGVMNGLKSGWLSETEKLVEQYYGLIGDDTALQLVFESAGPDAAWITGTPDPVTGALNGLALHINLSQMGDASGPDGGTGPLYDDRKIARALSQAVLARNGTYAFVDDWFKSGMADFIPGGNEALQADVAAFGAAGVISALNDTGTPAWVDDSRHRSSAYLAMRYLQSLLPPGSPPAGSMTDFFNIVKSPGGSVGTAMNALLGMSTADFVLAFQTNGATFLSTLNLAGADVGGIGGGDAKAVIPNPPIPAATPLAHFQVDWASLFAGSSLSALMNPIEFTLQIGANQGETMNFAIAVISTFTLNLVGLDVVNNPSQAIDSFGAAIQKVSATRSVLGSVENRLEHVMSNNSQASIAGQASYSRIRDVDFAMEVSELTRHQILVAAGGAMAAQANTLRQHVMWLLNGTTIFTAGAGSKG